VKRVGKALRDPMLLAWVALCAVTALSLVIGGPSSGVAAGMAVLAIALAKAGVVMFVFMDLRVAPTPLRLLALAWLALVLGALLTIQAGVFG
jgi:hypothetical protein